LNQSTLDYIRLHAADDVRRLALQGAPEDVDLRAALQQIEGRQLAARKLPLWAATDGLLFPPRLSLEQCSSEATAAYKRSLVERIVGGHGATFVDLTAGFGVDFSAIAPLFTKAVYVDRNPELCELAEHNFNVLGLAHTEVRCTTAEEALQQVSPGSFVMLDPARRDAVGRKVALIEDCAPDVCALQDELRAVSSYVLIKLSPMLDLTAALRALHGILEVHVVSVEGECKELLLLMEGDKRNGNDNVNANHNIGVPVNKDVPVENEVPVPVNVPVDKEVSDNVPVICVDLPLSYPPFVFTRAEEAAAPLVLCEPFSFPLASPLYIYEPSSSLLKAGAFRTICQRYPVQKLSPMSHLYAATEPVNHFPGRTWKVVDGATFAKRDLRRLLAGISAAELSVRGFPTSVAVLRRQLRLREGGSAHFVATTLADGTRVLLRVERLS